MGKKSAEEDELEKNQKIVNPPQWGVDGEQMRQHEKGWAESVRSAQ